MEKTRRRHGLLQDKGAEGGLALRRRAIALIEAQQDPVGRVCELDLDIGIRQAADGRPKCGDRRRGDGIADEPADLGGVEGQLSFAALPALTHVKISHPPRLAGS